MKKMLENMKEKMKENRKEKYLQNQASKITTLSWIENF
jgi:hypothetical protein